MGALHNGHISLIKQSQAVCDVTVSSVFVNPTQFDDADDFAKYPDTLGADKEKLETASCDFLLAPAVDEVYPTGKGLTKKYNFGEIGEVLEAAHRAGHFDGVAQVVKRLLDMVQPDYLFLGQKDYQQFLIVRKMIEQENLSIELVPCPIIREPHGLAMSSRNERLSPKARKHAGILHSSLEQAAALLEFRSINKIKQMAKEQIEMMGQFELEYFEIANATNLQPIDATEEASEIFICLAAYIEGVRLIDNMIIS
ncbi:UNVERIFIED_CONTAM: hypothetical protein GTU68_011153 [Idotea baltica]|nr:hypothetical protein [Idotea baltica]